MCISNELYCFEVKQNIPVELHTQALSAQSGESDTNGCSSKGTLLSYYVERIMERIAKGSDYDVGCDGRSEGDSIDDLDNEEQILFGIERSDNSAVFGRDCIQ